jgi:adenine-specific DNA-methyltransferase
MARLEFAGARYVRNYHLSVPHHELDLDKKKSLSTKPSLEDNLIVHGDNLKALKALLPHYAGKVKCIYIDPPYNTGNENWIYNDNVNSPRHKDWLGKVVDKDCQDRHDRWLSMMTPRLKLLKELLRDDGVIFISIDDNEVHYLRMLLNEIFGEENFLAQIIWEKIHSSKNDAKYYSDNHEYILCFCRNIESINIKLLPRTEEMNNRYTNPDNDPRGDWASGDLVASEERKEGYFEVSGPTGKKFDVPKGKHWVYSKSNMLKFIEENRIWFGSKGDAFPRLKRFLAEVQQGKKTDTIWMSDNVGHNQEAKREIKLILGVDDITDFPTPKPLRLIKQVLKISTDKNDIILDSFAGSGTTAHAVLALNKEDGGNRRFILVEQEDYADNITAERARRVIKGVKGAKDENLKNGLGGSFTYVTLGVEYDVAKILSGKNLPKYEDMAAYVFQTATGETLDPKKIDKKKHFIGSSKFYDLYLFYEPNTDKLKSSECALKLDFVESFSKKSKKKRLIFGAVRYVNQETMAEYDMEFCQLPYEVYRRIEDAA